MRSDVNTAYGYSKETRLGWSLLGYSGALKNGWHKAQLEAQSPTSPNKYVYSETTFRSFTPLNEFGEQFYVRSYDKDVIVENFPYKGSDVTLRFDPAAQSFTIVSQAIR